MMTRAAAWAAATTFWLAPLGAHAASADAAVPPDAPPRTAAPAAVATQPAPPGKAAPPALATPPAPPRTPAPTAPPAPPPPPATTTPPADAETALERARAAYEYGEMEMVVDSARLVAEGQLHPTPAQRAQALRYLGIALFLTERREGAETAFFDLLRLRPRMRLDTTTTRPDVVAFFESVRRRHAAEVDEAASSRPGKSFALAFLPPAGQFQSGHKARGITIAALEGLSLATAIGTYLQLRAWRQPGDTFGSHTQTAYTLNAANHVSIAVFVTTLIVGIIDGVASYVAVEPEDSVTSVADVFGRGYRF
jgi:hypothetical protein